ncbi:hypothetical protein X884_5510 [Burkholderia pseudomallei MSHR4308]|nr:hypothetical protein X883_29 [Burkholderia pseudomallei MSHR4304]KGV29751.1 hypothetical protein X884_5510 [Burkholderia pseudomallei MSHR4308]
MRAAAAPSPCRAARPTGAPARSASRRSDRSRRTRRATIRSATRARRADALDDERVAVSAQPRKQLASHPERRRTVRHALLDAAPRKRDPADIVECHGSSWGASPGIAFGHRTRKSRLAPVRPSVRPSVRAAREGAPAHAGGRDERDRERMRRQTNAARRCRRSARARRGRRRSHRIVDARHDARATTAMPRASFPLPKRTAAHAPTASLWNRAHARYPVRGAA